MSDVKKGWFRSWQRSSPPTMYPVEVALQRRRDADLDRAVAIACAIWEGAVDSPGATPNAVGVHAVDTLREIKRRLEEEG